MNVVTHFDFKSSSVRIAYDENGEPLFCLADVCKVLDIKNQNPKRFDLNSKGLHKMSSLTNGGTQQLTFISEGNLYRLVLRSSKPEAADFQALVCDEVMPTIRKTGSYTAQSTAYEEFNRLCMQEKLSKDKGSFHSLGMHQRKREKRLNNKRINAFKAYIQLTFNDVFEGVTP
jgi:prophage antirepressor-like protein